MRVGVASAWPEVYGASVSSATKDFSEFADHEPRLFSEFHNWLHEYLTHADVLVIEQAFIPKIINASAARLHGLSAIARMTAYQRGIENENMIEVPPAKWRKVIFGKGNMNRREAKLAALAQATVLGHPTNDDNEAEAICIFEWYRRSLIPAAESIRNSRNVSGSILTAMGRS